MSRLSIAGIVMVAACKFHAPNTLGDDDQPVLPDAPTDPDARDAPDPDGPPADARTCFGAFTSVCLMTLPPNAKTFTNNTTIDTMNSPECVDTTNSVAACVVAYTAITIDTGVTVSGIGPRPLILLATEGAITVTGSIDVSSKNPNVQGAGFGTGSCNAGTNPSGGGGGQGGSLGGQGGDGGDKSGGDHGKKGTTTPLDALRGGCGGAAGAGSNPGATSRGGGAVELIADHISVVGKINASGAGGHGGGNNDSGGGGGGSGGAIVFATLELVISGGGLVFSQGGGGGEASGSSGPGDPGNDPIPPAAGVKGSGQSTSGGDGGTGSTTQNGSNGQTGSGGGGGGGGGAGVIHTTSPATNTGTVSPPFS